MEGTIGTLRSGVEADVTVLNDDRGRWVLQDNEKTQVVTDRMLTPAFCLRKGERFDADASILPVAQAA
jgi:dihydroorotase